MKDLDKMFKDPPNTMVISLKRIFDEDQPILYVSHDEDDGMWQFLDGNKVEMNNVLIVSLQEVINKDPSIIDVSDLPLGWIASRENLKEKWQTKRR